MTHGMTESRPEPPPGEPRRADWGSSEAPEDRRRLGEDTGIRRHSGTEQRIGIGDDGADGEADVGPASRRRGGDRRHPATERLLRKRRDAQADLVADADARDVLLADTELELERIGATDDDEEIARVQMRADAFVGTRRQDHTAHRRADDARAELLVQEVHFATQYVDTETLKSLVGR